VGVRSARVDGGARTDDRAFIAEQTALKELADDRDATAAKIKELLSDGRRPGT